MATLEKNNCDVDAAMVYGGEERFSARNTTVIP